MGWVKNTIKAHGQAQGRQRGLGVKGKYWIFKTVYECPLCGKECTYQEKRYDKKPDDYNKRYEFIQNACDCHFV
jgi:hypothetical protein